MTASRIAEVGALVGDPARANILCALLDGRALTASELAAMARVSPQTASGHLAKLTDAHLLDLVKQGRHRYYRLKNASIAGMLEHIMLVAADGPARYQPRSRLDDAMRQARTCYDHFAGQLGVALTQSLCERGHIVLGEDTGEVTDSGVAFLCEFGIDLEETRRRRRAFCRTCLDWTERRPHLSGSLGAALATRCLALDWFRQTRGSRALTVTTTGTRGLEDVFGVAL